VMIADSNAPAIFMRSPGLLERKFVRDVQRGR